MPRCVSFTGSSDSPLSKINTKLEGRGDTGDLLGLENLSNHTALRAPRKTARWALFPGSCACICQHFLCSLSASRGRMPLSLQAACPVHRADSGWRSPGMGVDAPQAFWVFSHQLGFCSLPWGLSLFILCNGLREMWLKGTLLVPWCQTTSDGKCFLKTLRDFCPESWRLRMDPECVPCEPGLAGSLPDVDVLVEMPVPGPTSSH